MARRYLEDYTVGSTAEIGSLTVSQDEIIAFGQRYDPQPFHVDPEVAKAWPYGGLIASGWHTAALTMRLIVGSEFRPAGGESGGGHRRAARVDRTVRRARV